MAPILLEGGVRLTLVDGRLVLQDGTAIGTTAPAGTGVVRAAALHPHGTLFVACERGWFVLDARHLILDPAELRDGVPAGSPRGVQVDAVGRVWVCTEDQFGVFDARFGFGRTFTAADGVPQPPYLGLSSGADGALHLHAAGGVHAYTPDRGPPPTLVQDGRDTGSRLPVVEASGGATLRLRRRHHHLLTPIDDSGIRGLAPGRHAIEIHAFDRDLRGTRVVEQVLEVPPPKVFDRRRLPLYAGLGAVLLFIACFVRERRRVGEARSRSRWVRSAATTAIVGVVGLQVLAAFLGYGRSWPFVGFTMYTENWHEGSVLHRPQLHALRADGTMRPLTLGDAGVLQDGYWQVLAELVFGPDQVRSDFLQQIEERRYDGTSPYVGFVLHDTRIRLTANGPVDVAPTVMVHHLERGPR